MVMVDSFNKRHCTEWKHKQNGNFLGLRTVPPLAHPGASHYDLTRGSISLLPGHPSSMFHELKYLSNS